MSKCLCITSAHDVPADDRFSRHVTSPPLNSPIFWCVHMCLHASVCTCVCVFGFLFVTEGLIRKAGNLSILKKAPVRPWQSAHGFRPTWTWPAVSPHTHAHTHTRETTDNNINRWSATTSHLVTLLMKGAHIFSHWPCDTVRLTTIHSGEINPLRLLTLLLILCVFHEGTQNLYSCKR